MDNQVIVIIALIVAFLAVVALVEALYHLWQAFWQEGHRKIRRRLRDLSAGGGHGKETFNLLRTRELSDDPFINRVLSAIPRIRSLDRLMEQAGSEASVLQLINLQFIFSIISFLLLWLALGLAWPLALIAGLLAGFGMPIIYLQTKRVKRQAKFVAQLPDTMEFLARALRSGNPFTAALHAVAKEMPPPVADEMAITFDEINYGLEIDEALYNLKGRVGGADVAYFVTAVLVQRRTGGNLADVLSRIASMMRERNRASKEVQIQAAEMKLSAYILIGLPFFVAGFLYLFRREYMATLFEHPLGQIIIFIQLFLILLGYLVIRRMINFRI